MKKFLAILAFASVSAIAEPVDMTTRVTCDTPEEIAKVLKDFRETVKITGQSSKYKADISIWVSPNGTYSILVRDKQTGNYCALDHGESLKLIYNGKAV